MARGMELGQCFELWSVDRPDQVEGIHRAYREVGCDLVSTNSFGGSEAALARFGLRGRCEELNRSAAAVARRAAGTSGWVLGDVGPFGGYIEPSTEILPGQLEEEFQKQVWALYEGGADAIIIETMTDPAEMELAIGAAKTIGRGAVIATYAFERDGQVGSFHTMFKTSVSDAIRRAIDAGADVVGANCGRAMSLEDYRMLAYQLRAAAGSTPVIVQPNAGTPSTVDGQTVYSATPGDLANLTRNLLDAGVRIVGGCCGTTPEHMRAVVSAVRSR
jgi:5-methyltetrahydrofolate--homocysteine methyltransferase